MFMLNNFLRPILKDNPPPRILALRLAPILLVPVVLMVWAMNYEPTAPAFVRPLPDSLPVAIGNIATEAPVGGNLVPGERHVWLLDGVKGQRFAVTLDADWDSHLALYMPDTIQTLAQDGFSTGNGRAWIDGVTLPADGKYSLVVSGENGGAGTYQLRLTEAVPAQAPMLRQVGAGGLLISQ